MLAERDWQAQVIEAAILLGWTHYHTHDSRRSSAGFPDLVLVRERVLFVELKSEKGVLSVAQEDWLMRLEQAGAEVIVARPSDLDELTKILSPRV